MKVMRAAKQQIQEDEYIFPYHYLDLLAKYAYTYRTMQSYRQIVRELIAPYNNQKVLDAGCGDGRFCYDVRREKLQVMGIDYSEQAIRFARAFCPSADFLVGDLTQCHPEDKFDVILLMDVLEHFEPDKISRVLFNLSSCLADNGKLIITVPSKRVRLIPKHYQHFTVDDLKTTVKPYFEVTDVYGHLRTGLKYSTYRALLKGNYLLGQFRTRFGPVGLYYWLIERLLASIENCQPDRAARLIAVCKKTAPVTASCTVS